MRVVCAGIAVVLLVPAMGCGEDGSRSQEQRPQGKRKFASEISKAICRAKDPPPRVPSSDSRETLVASIGDSLTAGTPCWHPDPQVRRRMPAVNPSSQYEYWAERRLPAVRFRNCGSPGAVLDRIAGQLERCSAGADALIVQGGTNDLGRGAPVATVARKLERLVQEGKRRGLRVAIAEVPPRGPANDKAIRALNRRLAAIGRSHSVSVLPWYRAIEDPRRPGYIRKGWTIDEIHPTIAGYRRLGFTVRVP